MEETPPPPRPQGDLIDVTDPKAVAAWAAWLRVDEAKLRRLVAVAGSSAGQMEYILGINPRSRW
jgi:Protein of unknown function (DUF3606)